MLPDSLCSSCNNGYTSLDLHTLTQLCIGLLRYSKSYDFTLCPRHNTEHSNCDIDREKLRTISHRNPRLHVAGCGPKTWWRNRKRNFSNPLCILTSLWKERTITINSFCCCCCCFIFGKKFLSHVHVTKADLKEKSFIFLFSSSTEDEPWKTFWVNGIIS